MIEVQYLTKRYGDLTAVSEISFSVASGQILGFLGPNGSGKTTTMRIITGFLPATSGTVKVAGFDIFDDSFEVRKRIGYLPEAPPLYNDMTVAAYLQFVARIKGITRQTSCQPCRIRQLLQSQRVLTSRRYLSCLGGFDFQCACNAGAWRLTFPPKRAFLPMPHPSGTSP